MGGEAFLMWVVGSLVYSNRNVWCSTSVAIEMYGVADVARVVY